MAGEAFGFVLAGKHYRNALRAVGISTSLTDQSE
jgi:hypothetical protein